MVLINAQQAADILRISKPRLYQLVSEGKVPALQREAPLKGNRGSALFFDRDAIKRIARKERKTA